MYAEENGCALGGFFATVSRLGREMLLRMGEK